MGSLDTTSGKVLSGGNNNDLGNMMGASPTGPNLGIRILKMDLNLINTLSKELLAMASFLFSTWLSLLPEPPLLFPRRQMIRNWRRNRFREARNEIVIVGENEIDDDTFFSDPETLQEDDMIETEDETEVEEDSLTVIYQKSF